MARITSINPQAAASLTQLRDDMTVTRLARQEAATALQRTARNHKLATLKARAAHKRRPRVTLT